MLLITAASTDIDRLAGPLEPECEVCHIVLAVEVKATTGLVAEERLRSRTGRLFG